MIKEVENEKDLRFIKIIACFVIYFIIGVVALFTFAITRVDAYTSATSQIWTNGSACLSSRWSGLGTLSCINNTTHVYQVDTRLDMSMTANTKYTMFYSAKATVYFQNDNGVSNIEVNTQYRRGSNSGTINSCQENYSSTISYDSSGNKMKTFDITVKCVDVQFSSATDSIIVFSQITNNQNLRSPGLQVKITQLYLEKTGTDNNDVTNSINNGTNAIINNQNNNTNTIINNQNNNTTQITGELEDINSTLNDSTIDDPSSALNGMHNYFGSNGVISDLLLLPVRMFQSIVNTIDGTCSPFNLGTLFGHNLTMPCINLSSRLGSSLYGVIDILISGFFILTIRKKFVDIFEHFTSLKTGGNELE